MNGLPTLPPELEPQGFFSGIRPAAVLIGALVDNLSTLLLSITLLALISAGYESPSGELDEKALEALAREPGVLVGSMLLGSFCTALGGLMAARVAACHRARHGAFVGLAAIAVGLVSYGSGPTGGALPLWYDLLGFAILVPAGAFGGWASRLLRPPTGRNDPRESPGGPTGGPS